VILSGHKKTPNRLLQIGVSMQPAVDAGLPVILFYLNMRPAFGYTNNQKSTRKNTR